MDRFPVLSPVIDYEKIVRVGEGTYGVVYKARHRRTGELVALKRVRMDREKDGFPVTSLRELRLLQMAAHENVVRLKDVVTGSKLDSIFLVFEYCPHDLSNLLSHMERPFSISETKSILRQILSGVAYLHGRRVIHRDIKLSNLLYTDDGIVKICDFGLARSLPSKDVPLTPQVVTLWYRGPEILLGAERYSTALDMWAVGCIMGELLNGRPLFPGKTEMECLQHMCKVLGTPSKENWEGFESLPNAGKLVLPRYNTNRLGSEVGKVSPLAIDLLSRLLTYEPKLRISAKQALQHPYLQEHPVPKEPHQMPRFPSLHDLPSRHSIGTKRTKADDDRLGEVFGPPRNRHRGAVSKRSRP